MTPTALEYVAPAVEARRDRSNFVAVIPAVLVFAGLAIYCAVMSYSDIEADAVTHYMIARFALKDPIHLVSVWGRPLCTLMYVIPAVLGRQVGVRLASLAMALAIGAITYRIAARQKMRYPAFAQIFLFAQPLFFLHAWSSLTEVPFALFLSLAFLAYQRRSFFWMALLVAFLPLGRPEGFGFILLAAFALVMHRKWWWLVLLPLPFLAWNYAGWVVVDRPADCPWWDWVHRNWPYSGDSMYKKGGLFSYIGRLPALVGPFAFPFMLLGIWFSFRMAWRAVGLGPLSPGRVLDSVVGRVVQDDPGLLGTPSAIKLERGAGTEPVLQRWFRLVFIPGDHLARCAIWIALIPLLMLVVHSLLHWTGKMGSSGELRYLVIGAPFWALLAAQGLEWFATRFTFRYAFRWLAVGAVAPMIANWHDFPRKEVPFPRYADDYVATVAAKWYRGNPKLQADYPLIVSTPPGIWLRLDIGMTDKNHTGIGGKVGARAPLPGTVLFWDPVNGNYNSSSENTMPKVDLALGGWVYVGRFDCSGSYAEVYLSPRNIRGEATVWNESTLDVDACEE